MLKINAFEKIIGVFKRIRRPLDVSVTACRAQKEWILSYTEGFTMLS